MTEQTTASVKFPTELENEYLREKNTIQINEQYTILLLFLPQNSQKS